MQQYRKTQKFKKGKSFVPVDQPGKNNKKFFQKVMEEYERKKTVINENKQRKEEKRKKIEEARKKYLKKKQENFKKLSQKTKWGQPVMKGRMEILLEKIQKSVANSK
ncbi:hypothetical protein CEXT_234811 [Caerostris extrusa]|uniref:Thyroid transcription factor 1-associated protein 26 n=1 Tax=Caerostris extrusa TaxID=172846 RepID=A0AAV4QMA9_CAEEX|nr:hypothetical protein CEXT_234811 [Caerostris extrusa]